MPNFVGMTSFFQGSIDDIPDNWQLSDGTNGTIDLRNKFIMCAGSAYAVGSSGGSATHTNQLIEVANHNHNGIGYSGDPKRVPNPYYTVGTNDYTGLGSNVLGVTGNTGAAQAYSILPPYYALAIIVCMEADEESG